MKQIMTDEEYQEKYGETWKYQKSIDLTTAKYLDNPREGWTDEQYKEAHGDKWEMWKKNDEMTPEKKERLENLAVEVVEQQEEKKHKETRIEQFRKYAQLPTVQEIFANILGSDKRAKVYVESVFIQVAARPDLQKCSAKSIIIAAAQAASLKLSVDPIMQQAHLAVYNNEVKMIPDYHGLVQMSEDTGYYEIPPNVSEVWEGEEATTDRFTGRVTITGKKVSDVITGWVGYFKAKNGTERWLHMTNEQCDHHAETYNPGGYHSKGSAWNNKPENRDKMRRKTVLRSLVRKWGHFSPTQTAYLVSDEPVIEAQFEIPDEPEIIVPEEKSPEQESAERQARIQENLTVLGYQAEVK